VTLTIEVEQETDGRWIAEIPQLPGVLAYGTDADNAAQLVRALAFVFWRTELNPANCLQQR
jgi:predicted RNase H-like HicB family nuclease